MRCYWEELGVLGPIYELIGQGLSDQEIARKLNFTEVTVRGCTRWLMHFLKCENRTDLVLYALPTQHVTWDFRATHIAA
jgi:DNA-binding NarL/FixJ family response regulator